MRTGAASALGYGAMRHNENDVTMTIAGLWRFGDWRHVVTHRWSNEYQLLGCVIIIYGDGGCGW